MQSAVRRLPLLRQPIGRYVTALEARLLAASGAVITISEDFIPTLSGWGVDREKIYVRHNWAPLDELPAVSRDNRWRQEHRLEDKIVLLYSGTLGRKHNPELLLDLARRFRDLPNVAIVIASEGASSEWLRRQAATESLTNLLVLGFQPYERLPEALGTGDILLAILEEEAGVFSVPSKILSYQCAGRPILAYVPAENLSCRIIETSRAGIAIQPGDHKGYIAAAERLINDEGLRQELGANGRRYAEETFNIRMIGDEFEDIVCRVAGSA